MFLDDIDLSRAARQCGSPGYSKGSGRYVYGVTWKGNESFVVVDGPLQATSSQSKKCQAGHSSDPRPPP